MNEPDANPTHRIALFQKRAIGLGDWLFDLDKEEEHAGIVPAVLALAKNPAAAKAKAAKARAFVAQRLRETMAVVRKHLPV